MSPQRRRPSRRSISAAACVEPLARAARHRHPGALAGQRRGDRPADPPAGAHHQGGPPGDPELHRPEAIRWPAAAAVGYGGRDGERRRPLRAAGRRGERHLRVSPAPPGAACQGHLVRGDVHGERGGGGALPAPPISRASRFRRWSASRTPAATRSPTTPARGAGDGGQAARGGRGREGHPGVTIPAFVTRTPEEFLELLRLRRPDPETGQPDMEKLGAFLAAHPESQPAIQATLASSRRRASPSSAYSSPHAFKLVDAEGEGTWVRCRWRPDAGEEHSRRRGARARPRLPSRRARRAPSPGPAAFELLLQVAAEGDPRRPHRRLARRPRAGRRRPPRGHRDRGRPRVRRPHRGLRPDPDRRRHRALRRPDPARPRPGRTRSRPIGGWGSRSRTHRPLRRPPSRGCRARTAAASS